MALPVLVAVEPRDRQDLLIGIPYEFEFASGTAVEHIGTRMRFDGVVANRFAAGWTAPPNH